MEKNLCYRSSLIVLLAAFLSIQIVNAQTENILFDLTKGEFNVTKIPYVHPITIRGKAMKGNVQVDGIRLVVKQIIPISQKDLKNAKKDLDQLVLELAPINAKSDYLADIIDEISAENLVEIKSKLREEGYKDFVDELVKIDTDADIAEKDIAYKEEINTTISELDSQKELTTKAINELKSIIIKLGTPDDMVFFKDLWQRTKNDTDFNFALPQHFEMSETYLFEFTLFISNPTAIDIDNFLEPLIKDFNSELDEDGYYENSAIKKRIQQAVDDIKTTLQSKLFTIDKANKDFTQGFEISEKKVESLAGLISEYYISKSRIITSEENVKSAYDHIVMLMESHVSLTAIHMEEILDILNDEKVQENALERHCQILEQIAFTAGFDSTTVDNILAHYWAIVTNRVLIDKNIEKGEVYFNEIQHEFDFIKELYIMSGIVTYENQMGSTDVEGIQLSTIYGVANIFLGNSTIELTNFAALNFRFGEFDNRLKKAETYKDNLLSRTSLMFGIATSSNLKYKGKDLENTGLGFKPIIGLHFEPMKHVNIGVGTIFFTQEPIGNNQRNPILRPFVSIGWDFNLFNYLIQKN